MISIEIPKARSMSDLEKFVIGLKQLAIMCHVTNTAELREDWLKWKVDYCKHFEIEPDYINESPLLPRTKKPFFNILLDDRAGLESAYLILKHVVDYANTESHKC